MSDANEQRVIAIVRLAAALITSALTAFGISADVNIIAVLLMAALAVICITRAWWKNENMTKLSQEAQEYFEMLKLLAAREDESTEEVPDE